MPEAAKKKRQVYSAPALEKGLDILELLATDGDPLTSAEIAARLGRSVGEIFRMIVVLEQRGYVASGVDDDRYSLTLKMFEVSSQVAPIKRLTSTAVGVMHDLAMTTHQSCHLVVYADGRGVIIAQEDSPSPRSFTVRIGAEAPLFESCSGHLILAFADESARERMMAAQPASEASPADADVNRLVKRVRDQGFESIKSRQIAGVHDIGYPVFDYSGKMQAALLIPFLEHIDGSEEVDFETCQRELASAAMVISRGLGYVNGDMIRA